jgi:hypothetical protein
MIQKFRCPQGCVCGSWAEGTPAAIKRFVFAIDIHFGGYSYGRFHGQINAARRIVWLMHRFSKLFAVKQKQPAIVYFDSANGPPSQPVSKPKISL